MKKFKVRMISAVLAFCMLLSGTVSVFAADGFRQNRPNKQNLP